MNSINRLVLDLPPSWYTALTFGPRNLISFHNPIIWCAHCRGMTSNVYRAARSSLHLTTTKEN